MTMTTLRTRTLISRKTLAAAGALALIAAVTSLTAHRAASSARVSYSVLCSHGGGRGFAAAGQDAQAKLNNQLAQASYETVSPPTVTSHEGYYEVTVCVTVSR